MSRHVVSRGVDTVSKYSMTGESLLEFMYTRTRCTRFPSRRCFPNPCVPCGQRTQYTRMARATLSAFALIGRSAKLGIPHLGDRGDGEAVLLQMKKKNSYSGIGRVSVVTVL